MTELKRSRKILVISFWTNCKYQRSTRKTK